MVAWCPVETGALRNAPSIRLFLSVIQFAVLFALFFCVGSSKFLSAYQILLLSLTFHVFRHMNFAYWFCFCFHCWFFLLRHLSCFFHLFFVWWTLKLIFLPVFWVYNFFAFSLAFSNGSSVTLRLLAWPIRSYLYCSWCFVFEFHNIRRLPLFGRLMFYLGQHHIHFS